jgi:hypothetical protein
MVFAASLLVLSGVSKILDALWAFKYDEEQSAEVDTVIFEGNLATWGWVWLVVGLVLIAAGVTVTRGAEWARWFGIVAAIVTGASSMVWIFYQPLWSILSVTLVILVVYALAVYGGRHPLYEEEEPSGAVR